MRRNPDPATICRELRETAAHAPTRERVEALRVALASKHESVVSVAAQGLAGWGAREALPDLRAAFDRACARDRADSLRLTLARAIARVVGPGDTKAVVEWFLSVPEFDHRWDLNWALEGSDRGMVVSLFRRAWGGAGVLLKVSMFHAARHLGSDGLDGVVRHDTDPFVRELLARPAPPFLQTPNPWRSTLDRMIRQERDHAAQHAGERRAGQQFSPGPKD